MIPELPIMGRHLCAFEIRYQLRQPAFWITCLTLAAYGVLTVATDVGAMDDAPGRAARPCPP
ncbi:MAG: hypothetical protein GY711_33740 [bacterium]|nr:hypothetical protein [bacterium]